MVKDNYGQTPMDGAALANENQAVLRSLLDVIADSMAHGNDRWAPLHSAGYEKLDAVQALIAAGADPMALGG